jgi:hypothetical protein
MPYIPKGRRDLIDRGLSAGENVGELTYAIQQLLCQYLEAHELRYQTLAECLGALEGAKLDLIERVVKPYEERKRAENGDVWPKELTGKEDCVGRDALIQAWKDSKLYDPTCVSASAKPLGSDKIGPRAATSIADCELIGGTARYINNVRCGPLPLEDIAKLRNAKAPDCACSGCDQCGQAGDGVFSIADLERPRGRITPDGFEAFGVASEVRLSAGEIMRDLAYPYGWEGTA